jgi:muramidase (phage lysozyme)
VTRDDLLQAIQHGNVLAFLRLVRAGETSETDDAYREIFGGGLFDAPPWVHPHHAVTGGALTSTAAGAYQFLAGTWDELATKFGFGDFSPINQDLGAVALIARRGALEDVIAGRVRDAIDKCGKEWASLPGSPYGQPTRTVGEALETYAQFGGQRTDLA